jgi:hypothetical protein
MNQFWTRTWKWLWPNIGHYHAIWMEWLRKTKKFQCFEPRLKPGSLWIEDRGITTCSVSYFWLCFHLTSAASEITSSQAYSQEMQKVSIHFVMPGHTKGFGSHWMDFMSLYCWVLLKSVYKIQFWLKSDNNGHFTWRSKYVFWKYLAPLHWWQCTGIVMGDAMAISLINFTYEISEHASNVTFLHLVYIQCITK